MSCPLCGEVCHCRSAARPGARLRSHFACDAAGLIDPEADDGSEERFAASLEARHSPLAVDEGYDVDEVSGSAGESEQWAAEGTRETSIPQTGEISASLLQTDFLENPSSVWKQEVAARLHSYRARRKPRPPRYPSLRLKFEPAESHRNVPYASASVVPAPQTDFVVPEPPPPIAPEVDETALLESAAEAEPAQAAERARIIEFPRTYLPPIPSPDELAESLSDRPRIVEVPDVEPPPPALGGISLHTEAPEPEKRPGSEIPLQTASMARRLLSSGIDGLMVLSACSLFGYIFFRLTATIPPWPQLLTMGALMPGILWPAYQYLLLVYTGSTPGLRLAGLRLSDFDGTPVPRSRRRWRVLASILSSLSLGLGLAWCFLDEDSLCWHDRITQTYLAPTK